MIVNQEAASFGKWSKIEDYHTLLRIHSLGWIGSRKETTYLFVCEDGNYVRCGCWFGTLDDFKKRVHDKYTDGQYRKEYDAAIAMFRILCEVKSCVSNAI